MQIYRHDMAGGFAQRHRVLVLALWAQVPLVAVVGMANDQTVTGVGISCVLLVATALAAMLAPGRLLAASLATLGLGAAASLVVGYGGDVETLHLYFPVVLAAAAVYKDARPLLVALGVIAGYHAIVGLWLPGTEDATWVAAHVGFLTLLSLTLIAGWRLSDEPPKAEDDDRYQISFSTSPIGMAVVKLSGEFVEVNHALATALGHTHGHFPGRNLRAFIHGDDMPLLGEAWEEMGNSGSHTSSQWMRCLTATGDAIWARVSLALVPHTQRQPALVIFSVEETTDFQNEQSKLEGLIRGRDEFVAAVGEEIRQPLGVLIDLTSGEPGLRAINTSALEIASTIDDLVTSARADSSPHDVIASSFDAGVICRDITTRLQEGGIVSVDARTSTVWADPDMTRQILTGLITTAIRYGGEKVRLQLFNSGPDTVIQIIDDGPALPDDQRERVFQADLRRGEPVTRPAAVGLSLTVARDLARRMEGDVIYRRTGDGFNVFELRLPSEDVTRTYKPRPRPRLADTKSV
jgi:PAS domain S-box-containing protein